MNAWAPAPQFIEVMAEMFAYYGYLYDHINDPRRVRDAAGGYTSVDERHVPIPWDGPTWTPTGPQLGSRPGTPCVLDYGGSHMFIAGVCCDCGLTY